MNRAILLFGYPGSGKGTQGKILSALPGFRHVAMGDILRGLTPAHPMYEAVQQQVRAGNLVPDEMVMELFAHHLETLNLPATDFVIVDGLPRSGRQVELLNRVVQVIKIFKLSIYDEAVVIDRLRKRAQAQNRADDASDAVIQHRLEIYRRETESCITSYPGTILTRIQANQPVFDVHLDIISALGKMRQIQFS
ncbi:MAG TPA: nucleoside monophosphate kinase [Polyangia bacterium]|jgi:adenylate kinase|nr:nucleoside monophosphate kinase [Polyangia bacterium]